MTPRDPPPGREASSAMPSITRIAHAGRYRARRGFASWSTPPNQSATRDLRILNMVEEAGRALVIAFNKWDLTDEERRRYLEREIERDLIAWKWAPTVNISALTGRNVDKLSKAIETAAESWETRISTGKLNAFLGRLPRSIRTCLRGKRPGVLVRQPARQLPAHLRSVHQRADGRSLQAVHRATASRRLRLRRFPGTCGDSPTGEAVRAFLKLQVGGSGHAAGRVLQLDLVVPHRLGFPLGSKMIRAAVAAW